MKEHQKFNGLSFPDLWFLNLLMLKNTLPQEPFRMYEDLKYWCLRDQKLFRTLSFSQIKQL